MKPVRILGFMSLIYLFLLVIAYFFPKNGISVTDSVQLKFPGLKNIIFPKTITYTDISKIIRGSDTGVVEINQYPDQIDTNLSAEMRAKLHRLQFPGNNRSVIFQFLEALYQLKNEPELIRIMHYGDSQIEGDRMSGTIRYNLQSLFGGSGTGLLPVLDVTPTLSVNKSCSPNWSRYTIFGRHDTTKTGKQFGPMLSFCRFSTSVIDSSDNDSMMTSAWVKLTPSSRAYSRTGEFDHLSIYLGKNKKPLIIEVYNKENLMVVDTLPPFYELKKYTCYFRERPSEITVKLRSGTSPVVYGLSLDNSSGIAVDNIPMRGSSGVDFNRTDLKLLSKFYQSEKVRLLILQFGVNVAPNIVEDYGFYEEWLYKNLISLKKSNPQMSIIVIGISDMARKSEEGGGYESLPNIEKIRDAQRNAAFRAECGFWDTYEAMGGKNSMPSWVFANPPLASTDFTHFNPEGARIIAQMFINALLAEYEDYIKSRKTIIIPKSDSLKTRNGKN